MSAEISALEVRIVGRMDDLEARLKEAEQKALEGGRQTARRFSDEFVSGMRRTGDAMSLAVSLPLALGMRQALKAASDAGEAQNAANQVFKDSIQVVERFADVSARSFGVSRRAAFEYTATLGAIFKASGLAEGAAAEMSVRTVQLAADLASLKNLRIEDALEKVRSGLVGEIEPLRSVGVLLSEQVIARRAVSEGLQKQFKDLTEGEKVQLRYREILAQTADAHGDFRRTSEELANSQRIVAAEWEDVTAKLAKDFLPVAKEAMAVVRRIAEALGEMDEGQRRAFGYTVVALAAAGPVMSGVARLVQAWAAVKAAADAAAVAQAAAAATGGSGAVGALGRFGAVGRAGVVGAGLVGGYAISEAVFGSLGRAADDELKARIVKAAEEYNRMRGRGPARLEDSATFRDIVGRERRPGPARGLLPPGMAGQTGDLRYDAVARAVLAAADEMRRSAQSVGAGVAHRAVAGATPASSTRPKGGRGRPSPMPGFVPLDPMGGGMEVVPEGRSEAAKGAVEELVRLQERLTEQTARTRLEARLLVAVREEDRIALETFGKAFSELTSEENKRLVEGLAAAERSLAATKARVDAEREAAQAGARRARDAALAVEEEFSRLSDLLGLTKVLTEQEKALAVARSSSAPPLAAGILSALGKAADDQAAKKRADEAARLSREWAEKGLEEERRLAQAADARYEETMQRLAERTAVLGSATEAQRYKVERLAESFGVGATQAERIASGMEKAERAMTETLRVERIEEARQALERLTEGVEDRFMTMLDGLLRNGFQGFFADVIGGFRQLLADMAREWVLSQVRRGVAGLIGGVVGSVFGGSAPSRGGSGFTLLDAPGGLTGPPALSPGVFGPLGGPAPALAAAGPALPGPVTVVVNVHATDARSFLASEGQIAEAMGRAASRAVRRNG